MDRPTSASLIRLWARRCVVLGAILCVTGGLLALSGCLGFLSGTPDTPATPLLLRVALGVVIAAPGVIALDRAPYSVDCHGGVTAESRRMYWATPCVRRQRSR